MAIATPATIKAGSYISVTSYSHPPTGGPTIDAIP